MAKDFNQAIVMGNLTRDPEMRNLPSGVAVANLGIATNRVWRDKSTSYADAAKSSPHGAQAEHRRELENSAAYSWSASTIH